MTVHIQGMGWFGAITALALQRADVPFVWSDIETPHQAWKASTGVVYPAGDERSERNRQKWLRWLTDGWLPKDSARVCQYVFAHKRPPHDGTYEHVPYHGSKRLRLAAAVAVAVSAQAIVTEARSRFAEFRVYPEEAVARRLPMLVAHGHHRADGWVWGWSRKVALTTPGDPHLAAFYGKRHRFDLTYAYPVPNEPGWWWAGSALVNESRPRVRSDGELNAEWTRWLSASAELFPELRITRSKPAVQGWRPKPRKNDSTEMLMLEDMDPPRLIFPALWHSGVRWAPDLVEQATSWAASFR